MGMSETPQEAPDGVADAVRGLSDNTQALVRHEIAAAQREMLEKAKRFLPAIGLLGAAGFFGVLSASAGYRLSIRLLEKSLPPATAAFVAAAGYGAAAGAAGAAGIQRLRASQAPVPAMTLRQTVATVTNTAKSVAGTATKTAKDTAKAVTATTARATAGRAKPAAGTTATEATDSAKKTAGATAKKTADTAKKAAGTAKATAGTTARKAADTAKKAGRTARAATAKASGQAATADQPEASPS